MLFKAASFFVLSFLIGGIPSGYLLFMLVKHADIRDFGSGNIGFTNVARSAGAFLGAVVLILDAGKAYLAVRLFSTFFEQERIFMPIFGCAVIAGNILNPYLGFRGGKGVATGAGAFVPIAPLAVLGALVVFGLVAGVSRYVSLGSVCGAAALAALLFALEGPGAAAAAGLVVALLVIAKHHENLARLLRGDERRLGSRAT